MSTIENSNVSFSIPYYVIREKDCFIDWLIKQFLLLFQGCRSQESINHNLLEFSSLNIRWLSKTQIQGLPDEKIAQLSAIQLYAFTESQINVFSDSQRRTFEEALHQYQYQRLETDEEVSSEKSELWDFDDPTIPLLSYFDDPDGMPYTLELPEEDWCFLQSPFTKRFIENRERTTDAFFNYLTLTSRDIQHIRNMILSCTQVSTYMFTLTADPERAEFLKSLLPEEDRVFLENPDNLRAIPQWQRKCSHIYLNQLVIVKCLLSDRWKVSKETLVWDIWEEPNRTSSFISLFLNGWLKPGPLTLEEKREVYSHWNEGIEGLQEKQVDLKTKLIDWPSFRIRPEEDDIKTLEDVVQLDSPRLQRLGSHKLNQYLQTWSNVAFQEKVMQTPLEDEASINIQSVQGLNLREFQKLSADKINELAPLLPPAIIAILSERQLAGLNTALLSEAQVKALFETPHHIFTDALKWRLLLPIFTPKQIGDMANKIPGNILLNLATEQWTMVNIQTLTEAQLRCVSHCPYSILVKRIQQLPPNKQMAFNQRLQGLSKPERSPAVYR